MVNCFACETSISVGKRRHHLFNLKQHMQTVKYRNNAHSLKKKKKRENPELSTIAEEIFATIEKEFPKQSPLQSGKVVCRSCTIEISLEKILQRNIVGNIRQHANSQNIQSKARYVETKDIASFFPKAKRPVKLTSPRNEDCHGFLKANAIFTIIGTGKAILRYA